MSRGRLSIKYLKLLEEILDFKERTEKKSLRRILSKVDLLEFRDEIDAFWKRGLNQLMTETRRSENLKAHHFGGQVVPGVRRAFARKAALYCDQIVITEPVSDILHNFNKISDPVKVLVNEAKELLSMRKLIEGDVVTLMPHLCGVFWPKSIINAYSEIHEKAPAEVNASLKKKAFVSMFKTSIDKEALVSHFREVNKSLFIRDLLNCVPCTDCLLNSKLLKWKLHMDAERSGAHFRNIKTISKLPLGFMNLSDEHILEIRNRGLISVRSFLSEKFREIQKIKDLSDFDAHLKAISEEIELLLKKHEMEWKQIKNDAKLRIGGPLAITTLAISALVLLNAPSYVPLTITASGVTSTIPGIASFLAKRRSPVHILFRAYKK